MSATVPSGSLFKRAAHYLHDYVEIIEAANFDEDQGWQFEKVQIQAVIARLKEMDGEWEERVSAPESKSAASIVASMLRDWEIPGAVWFLPRKKRFRLVGENYRPNKGEICVGVYGKDASVDMLEEDFRFVMDGRT